MIIASKQRIIIYITLCIVMVLGIRMYDYFKPFAPKDTLDFYNGYAYSGNTMLKLPQPSSDWIWMNHKKFYPEDYDFELWIRDPKTDSDIKVRLERIRDGLITGNHMLAASEYLNRNPLDEVSHDKTELLYVQREGYRDGNGVFLRVIPTRNHLLAIQFSSPVNNYDLQRKIMLNAVKDLFIDTSIIRAKMAGEINIESVDVIKQFTFGEDHDHEHADRALLK